MSWPVSATAMGPPARFPGRLENVTETFTDEPADAVPEAPPTEPSTQPPARRWGRRLAILALLAVAVGILAWGTRSTVSGDGGSKDQIVVSQFPVPDALALRQTEVGADLLEGYDGRIVVNGTAIPEEQMEGVVDPTSPEAAREGASAALRPNNRRHVFFAPGPGKVIEKLPQGKVVITVTYFRDGRPDVGRGAITWTITTN